MENKNTNQEQLPEEKPACARCGDFKFITLPGILELPCPVCVTPLYFVPRK